MVMVFVFCISIVLGFSGLVRCVSGGFSLGHCSRVRCLPFGCFVLFFWRVGASLLGFLDSWGSDNVNF